MMTAQRHLLRRLPLVLATVCLLGLGSGLLPAGGHLGPPGLEEVEFTFEVPLLLQEFDLPGGDLLPLGLREVGDPLQGRGVEYTPGEVGLRRRRDEGVEPVDLGDLLLHGLQPAAGEFEVVVGGVDPLVELPQFLPRLLAHRPSTQADRPDLDALVGLGEQAAVDDLLGQVAYHELTAGSVGRNRDRAGDERLAAVERDVGDAAGDGLLGKGHGGGQGTGEGQRAGHVISPENEHARRNGASITSRRGRSWRPT